MGHSWAAELYVSLEGDAHELGGLSAGCVCNVCELGVKRHGQHCSLNLQPVRLVSCTLWLTARAVSKRACASGLVPQSVTRRDVWSTTLVYVRARGRTHSLARNMSADGTRDARCGTIERQQIDSHFTHCPSPARDATTQIPRSRPCARAGCAVPAHDQRAPAEASPPVAPAR